MEDPTRSVREISRMMIDADLPFGACKTGVSETIAVMNIKVKKAIKRPMLTDQHVTDRMQFATDMSTDIRHTLPWFFTDECAIDLNPYRRSVYAIPGMKTAEKIFQEYTKHPIHIMVWGGIARNYKSPLVLVKGTVNAQRYIGLLTESRIIETLDALHSPKGWIFQDDGATPHRARITTAWLRERCVHVAEGNMKWPANSPDLNPQEEMWALLRRKIRLEGCKDATELYARALAAWDEITPEMINRITDSFPVRLLAVQALKGGCLNGHRKLMKQLQQSQRTAEQIAEDRDEEKSAIRRFLESSRHFFMEEVPVMWERKQSYAQLVARS
jgi:hypothetical protein